MAVIVTCFMLFLYAPLELLFTNQDEFWFDAYILVPIMFVVFCLICVISILVLALLIKLKKSILAWDHALFYIFHRSLFSRFSNTCIDKSRIREEAQYEYNYKEYFYGLYLL